MDEQNIKASPLYSIPLIAVPEPDEPSQFIDGRENPKWLFGYKRSKFYDYRMIYYGMDHRDFAPRVYESDEERLEFLRNSYQDSILHGYINIERIKISPSDLSSSERERLIAMQEKINHKMEQLLKYVLEGYDESKIPIDYN